MEAAIRWSSSSNQDSQRFLIVDVARNRLEYGIVTDVDGENVDHATVSYQDKLPNFTAFDWSKNNESHVAIGTAAGEAKIISIDPKRLNNDILRSFPVRTERKCNSIALSRQNLLATGLDRARNDPSLNVYDLKQPSGTAEPIRRLSGTEVVSNVKFFSDEPSLLLAGISRQCIRLYDLREASNTIAAVFQTRNVHFLSIDPLDECYFASAGPVGENTITIWDRRFTARQSPVTPTDSQTSIAVLDVKPAIDTSFPADIWSLRYSGFRRGSLGVLSSSGQIRLFQTTQSTDPVSIAPLTARNLHQPSSNHYMKRTYDLQRPWNVYDSQNSKLRPIAFDFVNPDTLVSGECILTLRQNRNLELIKIPSTPPLIHLTSTTDICLRGESHTTLYSSKSTKSIAEDLVSVQTRVRAQLKASAKTEDESDLGTVVANALNQRSPVDKETAKFSSRKRHEALQYMAFPPVKMSIDDSLIVAHTQQRRCKEGYLFDCEKNKAIVSNDPWLTELWDTIKRLEDVARHDGMVSEAVDLSYLGVHSLWTMDIGANSRRCSRKDGNLAPDVSVAIRWIRGRRTYPAFEGIQTHFPDHRQLCLALCGWRFSESRLREKCMEIIARGEYYKAIAVAVCHGRKDVALDLLKRLNREKKLDNLSLGAVIATETIDKEQRQLCAWMAEESNDPYLTMLLTYFVTGDWNSVVTMTELPLVYRVAVALKFLDDDRLSDFIDTATKDAIEHGDTEGILLTGLGEESVDLFQKYIARSNDLQTAVLATSFTNPQYVDDRRWQYWKDTYFMQMQTWKAFIERTRFTVQHNRKSIAPHGRRLVQPPPRQVTLQCNHCHMALAKYDSLPDVSDDDSSIASGVAPQKGSLAAAGTVCPKCDRPMPRCGICMMWLGTPDPSGPAGAAALSKGDPLAKFITFCMSCGHGCHAHHARDWFSKHSMCPIPDCQCTCGAKH